MNDRSFPFFKGETGRTIITYAGSLRGRQPPIPFPPLPFRKGKGIKGLGFPPCEDGGWKKITLKYAIISFEMRNFIKISGFILIVVGTAGLLLNEFVWEHSSTRTIIFAVVNFVGLVNLAFAHFGLGRK